MMLELGGKDRFNFASGSQKLLRANESLKLLLCEFDQMNNIVNMKEWQNRINHYKRMVGAR